MKFSIERFHSHGQHTCKFTETKGSVYIRKEFNSQMICLEHQLGRRFIVLEPGRHVKTLYIHCFTLSYTTKVFPRYLAKF